MITKQSEHYPNQIRYEHQIIPGMLITKVYFASTPKESYTETFKVVSIEETFIENRKTKYINILKWNSFAQEYFLNTSFLGDSNVHSFGCYNDHCYRYPTNEEIINFNQRRQQMISKRTLEKWRKQALSLEDENLVLEQMKNQAKDLYDITKEYNTRILKLTQELLDQQLLNK